MCRLYYCFRNVSSSACVEKRSQKVNKVKKANHTINVFVYPRIHGVLKKKNESLIIPRIADWFSNLTTKDVYKPVGVNM